MPKGGCVGKIGVATGDFSRPILDICRPKHFHLIDYWGSAIPQFGVSGFEIVQQKFKSQIENKDIVINRGISWEVLRQFPDSYFDWVYLDAAHDYDSVRKDLSVLKSKIKPNGIIAGHDYVHWSNQTGRFGVIEAVNEFCLANSFEMIYLTLQKDMHNSFAIRCIEK